MAASASALRESALKSGKVSKVSVNQRALVTKMLARYSSDYVVVRELVQNADDAGATRVRLAFSSDGDDKVTCLAISNNGRDFTAADWQRLAEIASGNPSEEAVGAFGVGFYSVFSFTDCPVVKSGAKHMLFTWRDDNQLATHLASSPPDRELPTSVLMDMREARAWDMPKLRAFLARAVCFTRNVEAVELTIDGAKFAAISRSISSAETAVLPQTIKSPDGFFAVSKLVACELKLLVEAADRDAMEVVLRHVAARAKVSVSDEFRSQALRIMKKKLPSTTTLRFLWNSAETAPRLHDVLQNLQNDPQRPRTLVDCAAAELSVEHGGGGAGAGGPARKTANSKREKAAKQDGSGISRREAQDVITALSPLDPETGAPVGRVFIGLATHQTNGAGFHVHGNFIPTVEREQVDFQDPYLGHWNSELASLAGGVSRAVYDKTFSKVSRALIYKGHASVRPADVEGSRAVTDAAILAQNFVASHPSTRVGELVASGFFDGAESAPMLLARQQSTWTAVPASRARLPSHGLENLVRSVPVVSVPITKAASGFFVALRDRGLINEVSTKDLKRFIVESPVELESLLTWFCTPVSQSRLFSNKTKRSSLLKLLVLPGAGKSGGDASVAQLKYYDCFGGAGRSELPTTPPLTLPWNVSERLSRTQLSSALGLKPLPLAMWIRHVADVNDGALLRDKASAAAVLAVASKHANSLSAKDRSIVMNCLRDAECMPVRGGAMIKPVDAYLPSPAVLSAGGELPTVDLNVVDDDAPVDITLDDTDGEDKNGAQNPDEAFVTSHFLKQLGVRSAPAVGVLLAGVSRHRAGSGSAPTEEGIRQLVKSLMCQRADITPSDVVELKSSAFLPAEGCPGQFSLQDLHFPSVALELGEEVAAAVKLRVVAWSSLTVDTAEGAFLKDMGLRDHVELGQLLEWCATLPDTGVRTRLRTYFFRNFKKHYELHYRPARVKQAFLPCTAGLLAPPRVAGRAVEVDAAAPSPPRKRRRGKTGKGRAADVRGTRTSSRNRGKNKGIAEVIDLTSDAEEEVAFDLQPPVSHNNGSGSGAGGPPASEPTSVSTVASSTVAWAAVGTACWCTPTECFSAPPAALMAAAAAEVLAEIESAGLSPKADIGIAEAPTAEVAMRSLLISPPTTATAARTFGAMAALGGSVSASMLARVRAAAVVPTDSGLRSPSSVYLRNTRAEGHDASSDDSHRIAGRKHRRTDSQGRKPKKGRYASTVAVKRQGTVASPMYLLADFVDYGEAASKFLATIGVKEWPTPTELAELLANEHQRFMSRGGSIEGYKSLLVDLAGSFKHVERATIARLKNSPFLLGYRLRESAPFGAAAVEAAGDAAGAVGGAGSGAPSLLGDGDRLAVIVKPQQCFLVDVPSLEVLLTPVCAPNVAGPLFEMYEALGCRWLGACVERTARPVGIGQRSSRAERLLALINERVGLLCVNSQGERLDGVRASRESRLMELDVLEVPSIEMTVSFEGITRVCRDQFASTVVLHDVKEGYGVSKSRSRAGPVLYFKAVPGDSDGVDYFDVAEAVANYLMPGSRQTLVDSIQVRLTSPLFTLERRGLPVKRLLNRTEEVSTWADVAPVRADARAGAGAGAGLAADPIVNDVGGAVHNFRDVAISAADVQRLVKRSRAERSDEIVGAHHTTHTAVEECEEVGPLHLRVVGTFGGVRLFLDDGVELTPDLHAIANEFGRLLSWICKHIKVPASKVQAYYDTDGARVAFNRDGAIFANLRYFAQVHVRSVRALDSLPGGSPSDVAGGSAEPAMTVVLRDQAAARSWWFVTLCHELAHNASSAHDHAHEQAMESVIARVLPRLAARLFDD